MPVCIFCHRIPVIICFLLQGEEILSQRSQGSDDDEEEEEEERSLVPQERSEDEVPAITPNFKWYYTVREIKKKPLKSLNLYLYGSHFILVSFQWILEKCFQ